MTHPKILWKFCLDDYNHELTNIFYKVAAYTLTIYSSSLHDRIGLVTTPNPFL